MATRQVSPRSARTKSTPGSAPTPQVDMTATGIDVVEPRMRPRRNPRMILIGILCAALGALLVVWAWEQGQSTQEVVIAARPISKGQIVSAQDFTVTTIGSAVGAAVVPANQLKELVGKSALTDLSAGAVVAPASVGSPAVKPGTAHVGLKLAAGRMPSQGLPAGTRIIVLGVGGENLQPGASAERFEATVVATPTASADGQSWLVDIALPETQATRVASLAASGQVALIRRADA